MNRKRFWLILSREYRAMVMKKSFLITTIIMPLLIVCAIVTPVLLSTVNSGEKENVAIVDRRGDLTDKFVSNEEFNFKAIDSEDVPYQSLLEDDGKELYAIVVIPADVSDSKTVKIYSARPVREALINDVESTLDRALTMSKIESYGIDGLEDIIRDSQIHVKGVNHTFDENGENVSSAEISKAVGLGLAFMTYMFVLMYGAMIMNSVVGDKTNRVVEVIISSCKPMELMLGKIIGVGLVGLTQMAVWVIILSACYGVAYLSGVMPDMGEPSLTGGELSGSALLLQSIAGVGWIRLVSMCVLYFIGGYLLFASLFAAFGSAVDQQSDAEQYTKPIMFIMIASLMIGQGCMENPDGTLAVICSMVPLTSPIVMMIRLPYQVPWWELLLSLIILYGSAIGICWLASRIYRVGILRYGRKFSIREVVSWIK